MTEGRYKIDSHTALVPVTLPVTEFLSKIFCCPNSQGRLAGAVPVLRMVVNLKKVSTISTTVLSREQHLRPHHRAQL